MKTMKKLTALLLSVILIFALAACGGGEDNASAGTVDDYSPEKPVTVRVGLTGAIYEDIWAPIAEKLEPEGILIETVQFADFSLPNPALNDGDIELNAFQHHAFFDDAVATNGFELTAIGDTYVIAMNIYSNVIDDVSQLKDGDQVAIPNDVTNGGRAIKLLEAAGLLTVDPAAGNNPQTSDITGYLVDIELVEVDAAGVCALLPDVEAAVINGNYALDNGLDPESAIFFEEDYTDNSYFCLIAARSDEADAKAYQRIVEVYQSDETKQIFTDAFDGFFVPVWED